ncbi:MAG: RnfABCDGE type electron transport complex subunit D [Cyanobacteriota bacterium]|nr:RnfABCDGE type electron transport complex subunit D [Cyanobacteriota bacterium]
MFKDARDHQILFLSTFLVLGISTRDWTLKPELMLVAILSCLLTQWLFAVVQPYFQQNRQIPSLFTPFSSHQLSSGVGTFYKTSVQSSRFKPFPRHPVAAFLANAKNFPISSLRSALITGLGLCLLLRANNWQTMALAGCLAIASKFLFRYREKHFFNPANFGIIASLIFTQDAWVSPGQWGTDWWYLLLFAGAGGIVLQKVGRWDTSATFLATYAGLEALRTLWLGQGWDVYVHHLMSGSLLLFALFMLTDPRSMPNARIGRGIWAIAIAWVAFILQHQFYLTTAIFWALFAISPLTVVLDELWHSERFTWNVKTLPKLPQLQ